MLVRALQKRCTEPGVGDRCISDASEPREVLDRNLCHSSLQAIFGSGELILGCLSGECDGCMMGIFGAQRDIHGTEGIYCVVRFIYID